jgi:hypothetical protein
MTAQDPPRQTQLVYKQAISTISPLTAVQVFATPEEGPTQISQRCRFEVAHALGSPNHDRVSKVDWISNVSERLGGFPGPPDRHRPIAEHAS